MSQPDTDLEKQKRRHVGPLVGMAAVLIFVGTILLWWLAYEADQGQSPQGADVQIDGRTGEPEVQDPPTSEASE